MLGLTQADLDRIIWVPVRHHSPAAARAVERLIVERRPEAVLIEGPSDYDDFDELALDHTLPIQIMCWLRWNDHGEEQQSYALYPITSFSAEWAGITVGRREGARVRFIDLPWSDQYALQLEDLVEGQVAPGSDAAAPLQVEAAADRTFFHSIAAHVGREDLSAVWDEFFEIDPGLSVDDYLARATTIGAGLRLGDATSEEPENLARERHMATLIADELARSTGPVMVITGAFHTSGLKELVAESVERTVDPPVMPPLSALITGNALVATSYIDLDADFGYLAGQPSPGFYDLVFASTPDRDLVMDLFARAIVRLRQKNVVVSTADTIAALTTARALQQVRGHARLWRDDLLDGIAAAVIKDDADASHPLLAIVRDEMRGTQIGRLASSAAVPPLVTELSERWDRAELPRVRTATALTLDLANPRDRERSRVLNLCHVLEIESVVPYLEERRTTSRSVTLDKERWSVAWTPRSDSAAILASRWGPSLVAAATARLQHRLLSSQVDTMADVLGASIKIGLDDLSGRIANGLDVAIHTSTDLGALGRALDSLVGFVHFDTWLGTVGRRDLVDLARTLQQRMVTVLATLGPQADDPKVADLNRALRSLAETTALMADEWGLDAPRLEATIDAQLSTRPGGVTHAPEFAGGLQAARWLMNGDVGDGLEASWGSPIETGQFYVGLMTVAGHLALAAPQIFDAADEALRTWSDESFFEALPDLRRAMTSLTTRERDTLIQHLIGGASGAVRFDAAVDALVDNARRDSELEATVAHWIGGGHA